MIETICLKCGQRYQVGTDHVCPKKFASAAAPVATKATKTRGRPKTGFDKAEYNRQYMRKKRASAKESGNG
jgi:hypothetical protein